MAHRRTKHRNAFTSRQKDRQKKSKLYVYKVQAITTSTTLTLTHYSVNTVLSLKRLTIELPHKDREGRLM